MNIKSIAGIYLAIFLFTATVASAQSFSIDEVNTNTYPSVSLKITTTENKTVDKANMTIAENGQNIDFAVIAGQSTGSNKKAVCFLIETSSFATPAQVDNMKNAVKAALNGLDATTAVANICYYNKTRPSGAMNRVSSEFTSDFPALVKDMNSRVNWVYDDTPATDLYKALYECIEFMLNKGDLPDNKQIILISTGNNNGSSPITLNDCAAKSDKKIILNGIAIRATNINAADNIKLACSKLNGQYEQANSIADITAAINKFVNTSGSDNSKSGNSFYLKYTSPNKGTNPATVKVVISGTEKTTTYQMKEVANGSLLKGNQLYFIIGGGVLLIIIMIVLLLSAQKRKKQKLQQEEQRKEEQIKRAKAEEDARAKAEQARIQTVSANEKTVVHSQQPASFDPRKTTVSGLKIPRLKDLIGNNYEVKGVSTSIGRNANNQISIQDATVSGTHALIISENGKWFLVDQNSTNGTFVNGQRISKTELLTGMRISFGKASCLFEIS